MYESESGGRLFDRRDVGILSGLIIVGLALRLAWFSGYGLGDDLNFLFMVRSILETGRPEGSYAYRFTWWAPTVALCRWLGGATEVGFIAPITAASMVGLAVVYAIGKHLWGRRGAITAALLLIVHPLDFAWSTMQANDIIASAFSALAMLGVLWGTDDALPPRTRRRGWAIAAWGLFFAYHAKISTMAILPAIAIILWWRRRRLWPEVTTFVVLGVLLFGAAALGAYALAGSPIAPYKTEMTTAGLRAADAAYQRRLTGEVFWAYPRMLFWRDGLGGWTYGFQPHLISLAALASLAVPFRWPKELIVWFMSVFLVMQFQVTARDGAWVSAFRNFRFSHAFVYPLVLLLAGVFVLLLDRWCRVGAAALAATVLVGLWASIDVASKTHACFGDERAVARYLLSLPPRPVHTDFHLANWLPIVDAKPDPSRKVFILASSEQERRAQLANYRYGYLVTGGGREPYYGCHTCIIRAKELPLGRYRLLREFDGPKTSTPWRPEPIRVWQGVPMTD